MQEWSELNTDRLQPTFQNFMHSSKEFKHTSDESLLSWMTYALSLYRDPHELHAAKIKCNKIFARMITLTFTECVFSYSKTKKSTEESVRWFVESIMSECINNHDRNIVKHYQKRIETARLFNDNEIPSESDEEF